MTVRVQTLTLRCLTFELSGRQRQDARPGLARMYRVPPDRAWWPAVGAPLERGVRQRWILAGHVTDDAPAPWTCKDLNRAQVLGQCRSARFLAANLLGAAMSEVGHRPGAALLRLNLLTFEVSRPFGNQRCSHGLPADGLQELGWSLRHSSWRPVRGFAASWLFHSRRQALILAGVLNSWPSAA